MDLSFHKHFFLAPVSRTFLKAWYCFLVPLFLLAFAQSCSSNKKKNNTEKIILGSNEPGNVKQDTAMVSALLLKAATFVQTDFDSMRYYAAKALQLSIQLSFPKGVADAKAVEANYQRRKGNYAGAIELGLEVIAIYDSLQLKEKLVNAKTLLADFYKEMGGEKGTPEYQQKGLVLAREAQLLAEKENYPAGIISSLNEQGIILRDISKTTGRRELMDSAFILYTKGIEIIKQKGEGEDHLGKLYNNISQVYNEHYQDYAKALDYQMKAVAFNTERRNQISLTHNYNTIAGIYLNMGNVQQANLYAHKMLALSKAIKAPFRLVNAYSMLREVHKKMKQYDSALFYFQQSVAISDSINNLEKSRQIADMQTKYETRDKESRIGFLDNLNKTKSQRLWWLGGTAVLLLLLLSVVWLQKRRSQLQQQKISQQAEKLQWMMKELHHRVKNNLQIVSSLLNLQSYRLKDDESAAAMRESQLRVQAMSLMHQRLYQVEDVTMVNFKLYLSDLADTLMKAYGYEPDKFDLSIKLEKEMLDVDTVMPLGLLVNEIITNSFKYAYENAAHPSLTITMQASDNQLQLQIADNGPGMDIAVNKQEGFGKKLIEALTKQLKATCSVKTDKGTSYTLIIPYQKEKAA
jgi:two-component sensor histidine kinase